MDEQNQTPGMARIRQEHEKAMERLKKAHEARMAEWEYLQSEENIEKVRQQTIKESHEDIDPPWED